MEDLIRGIRRIRRHWRIFYYQGDVYVMQRKTRAVFMLSGEGALIHSNASAFKDFIKWYEEEYE